MAQRAVLIDTTTNRLYADTLVGEGVDVKDAARGIILRSPDGTRYRVTVANGGTLTVTRA